MDRIAVTAKTVNMIVVVVSVHVLTTRTLVAMIVCCTVGYGIFRSSDDTSCNDCVLYCRLWYIEIIRRR